MKLLGRDKAATRAAASQPHGGAWLLGPAGVIITHVRGARILKAVRRSASFKIARRRR
jgi:hypothetical protein